MRRSHAAYDQVFHLGVNIIRGKNSSGKSTILDFMFYALGGDFVGWKPEAESCDSVLVEVEINNQPVTFRRGITKNRSQPMEIYWGRLDEAEKSPFEGWEIHPFRRSDAKESFSQVLFRMLGLPEVRSDQTANITMHQILRLICVDQLSNVNSLLRDEQWDSTTIRRTVGDLLYGIYDEKIYSDEIELREKQRQLEVAKAEYFGLIRMLDGIGQSYDIERIEEEIIEANSRIDKLRTAIENGISRYEIDGSPEESEEFRRLESETISAKKVYVEKSATLSGLKMEIADSEAFLDALEGRYVDLGDAIEAERSLGEIALNSCPSCLQELPSQSDADHCRLCGQLDPVDDKERHLSRIKNELSTQIHESKQLLEERYRNKEEYEKEVYEHELKLENLQTKLHSIINQARSTRDAAFDELLESKGAAEGKLELLKNQRLFAEKLVESQKLVGKLQLSVEGLQRSIRDGRGRQESRKQEVEEKIREYAVFFLHHDLEREELFQKAENVKIDFERNLCLVDDRSSFSASSISFLKASVHFAILFASLEVEFMRYPKIIINDNIEDKGMEEERSQNLQRLVVELSEKSEIQHQIILATSMISPELEGDERCIGPFYTRENKTLKL